MMIQFNSFMDKSGMLNAHFAKHTKWKRGLSVVHVFSIRVNWPWIYLVFDLKLQEVEVMISVSDFLKLEKESIDDLVPEIKLLPKVPPFHKFKCILKSLSFICINNREWRRSTISFTCLHNCWWSSMLISVFFKEGYFFFFEFRIACYLHSIFVQLINVYQSLTYLILSHKKNFH